MVRGTPVNRYSEVSLSPGMLSSRSIDSPVRFPTQSQGASPLRARMDAAEMTSLRRDLTRSNERVRELQQMEKDWSLKLRVKDDLLKRLHEELKEKSNATRAAFDTEIDAMQLQVAQKEADFKRSEDIIASLKADNIRLAEMNRERNEDLQHASIKLTEAEARVVAAESRNAEIYELQQQLSQQQASHNRLLEQSTLSNIEIESRDKETTMRTSKLEHDNRILEERLATAQEAARLLEEKSLSEGLKQACAEKRMRDLESVLLSLRSEIDSQKELEQELVRSTELNQQLKTRNEELSMSSAMYDVKAAEHQRNVEKGKEREAKLEKKLGEERELTTLGRNKVAELEVRIKTLVDELEGMRLKMMLQDEEASEKDNSLNVVRMKASEERAVRDDEASQLHERLRTALERVTRLETEKVALESEASRLKAAENSMKDDAKALRAKDQSLHSLLEAERVNFKRSLDEAANDKKSALQQVEIEKSVLRRELSDVTAKLIEAESTWGDLSSQSTRAVTQLEQEREMHRLALNDKSVEYRLKLERANVRIEELGGELLVARTKVEQATAELEHEKEDAAKRRVADRQRHEAHVKELQARHSANLLDHDDAAAKAAQAEHQVAYLNAHVMELKDEREHMKIASHRTTTQLEAERAARQADLLASQEKVSCIGKQLLDAQNDIVQFQNEAQREKDAQQTLNAELLITQEALSSLKRQIDKERDEHRRGLGAAGEERRKEAMRAVELTQELEESLREIAEGKQHREQLEEELDEERRKRSSLQDRYESGIRNQESALKGEQGRHAEEKQKMRDEMQRVEADNEMLRDEKIRLQDELIAKGKEMMLKNEEVEHLEGRMRQVKGEMDRKGQLERELDILESQKADSVRKEATLLATLTNAHSNLTSLSAQITSLNTENSRLRDQLAKDHADISHSITSVLQAP
eukprot:TRINITY_DN16367_c0_g1_i1.p1 TRINITY_DN16367_c0_g1~~TRINITY_DN16367_c0_g1_i1.p1  ORF type:complete len:932 (+),score=289.87 TRINITY_DN16367_c0_g1_i1:34-2829(+)